MKIVIRDYISGFRISRIRERYGSQFFGAMYFGIYLLAIAPISLGNAEVETYVNYYILACVTMFSIYSVWTHPVGMSKLMYLCPMSEMERWDYLMKSYLLKIGVPLLTALVTSGALCAAGRINWAYAMLVFAGNAGVILCNSLLLEKRVREDLKQKKGILLSGSWDGWDTLGIITAFFWVVFLLIGVTWQSEMLSVVGIVTALIMSAIELPLTMRILRNVRKVMELTMNYEKAV